MKISVTFRNTEGEDWQKEYINEKLKKLNRYADNPTEAHVILSVEKFRNVAEIKLMIDGLNVNAKEEAKDISLAIDNAVEKIERQLKKHKEKIRGHKANAVRTEEIGTMDLLPDDIEDTPGAKVVETKKVVLKPMSLEDAMMEIETSKNRFIIYRDSHTENVSVIYRRDDDGHYGLIETNA